MVHKEECGYIQSITNIHNYGYTYDGRGNLVKEEEICSPTTEGPRMITIGTYKYDETNRMVQGTNKEGEYSNYTYNGLGVRVGTELILNDNTHGYTDFHCQTPSVETDLEGPQGPEVVLSDYVIDYTRLNIDQRVLVEHEVDGYDFRYVYGLDKLQVRTTSEGSDWWGQHIHKCVNMDYVHTDRLGSVMNLTDEFGRVAARSDYSDWGEVTAYTSITVDQGLRVLLPEITYATHEYDDVLNQFYAKARFYDAENKRFDAMDPVHGWVTDSLSLVQYLYVKDNPFRWIDPLGTMTSGELTNAFNSYKASGDIAKLVKDVYDGTVSERNTIFHRITQVIVAKRILLKGGPKVSIAFEAYIADKNDRETGHVDVLAIKNNKSYAFEIEPKFDTRGNANIADGYIGDAANQLNKYYRIFKCNGIPYASTEPEYSQILPAGNLFNQIIFQTPKESVRLIIEHNPQRLPGYVTYQARYENYRNEEKNKSQMPNVQFSYLYQRHSTTYQQTFGVIDDAFYKVAGKHIHQLTNAELVGYGLAAGTIIVAGSAAAAWIGMTAISAAATIAPFTLQTGSGSLAIQVAADQAAAQAAATATGAQIFDFAKAAAAAAAAAAEISKVA